MEVMVVLAIVGVVAAMASRSLTRPAPARFANEVQAAMQRARFEAIRRNRAVVFAWESSTSQFVTRVKGAEASAANSQSCRLNAAQGDVQISAMKLSDQRGLQVASTFTGEALTPSGTISGVVWQPTGLARQCNATTMTAGQYTLSATRGGAASAQVRVSAAGRVRQQ